ncbi:MAG: transglutaminase family protein [Mesorhizobium sp.]|uniref:transglutaminase family protein n=1 Tax=Mesorhizobium sp. TaxID=1871066 RepID=UPI000FE3F958|nr:transglutaminase family protein [Mesorhizobium sp.]RWO42126.1 MAG: transglutaminase family protein [Mesorhizobium sp.]TIN80124.1 MAG: transglutaminase family protein [Mesorhizobium sp.]
MLYDIRLNLRYDYDAAAGGGRHQVRVLPPTISGVQRVIAASLSFAPAPSERSDFSDFFGNNVTSIAFRDAHDALDIRMSARVAVSRPEPGLDVSPDIRRLRSQLEAVRSLSPDTPHHFLAASDHVGVDADITGYARSSAGSSVVGTAMDLCNRIHRDFTYDGEATTVHTRASDAFSLKRGVCQDFSHIMIAGLRGLGIPAGYVSGFLRTIPPPGKPRLEGADAMHAWVKVWCGRDTGWQEFDPTNGMRASNDHITVGHGRDYSDVAPIVGVLKTTGGQVGEQAVDVIPVVLEKA